MMASRFVDQFPADGDVAVPSQAFLSYARDRVAPVLHELWSTHGIGFYGEQRIAIVDPSRWMPALQTWLGAGSSSVPIAVTSFGHIYHADRSTGTDRVQCLDPHFQTNTLLEGDLEWLLNEHFAQGNSHVRDLEGPRGGARAKLGPLEADEIYYFDPILALGGQVKPESLAKGDGPTHVTDIHQQVAASH